MRTLPVLIALVTVLAVGASQSSAERSAGATARAWAIRIVVPGQPEVTTRIAAAPPGPSVAFDDAFTYPADGSVLTAAAVTTSVDASSGAQARAAATAQVTTLSLFGGEITASAVTGETRASASAASASGDTGVTAVGGLVVLGTPVTPQANQRIQLGDWGYVIALEQTGQRVDKPAPGYHSFVTALDVYITADHGGLPAGSQIQIGYADANAQASEPAPLPKPPSVPAETTPKPGKGAGGKPVNSRPLTITPKLTAGGYVFPVYGESSYADTYGGARGNVSGGWHHGADIFAALGTPVLAVARGTVFSVGWNRIGGWRLWLRDDQGNQFYYAHMSAYSPYAVNGAIVEAGDVLGFIGNTGDARGTPYHVHFEVHPVGLLGLGYDGAVNPTPYLDSWSRLQDIRFDTAVGWLPRSRVTAPKAGAVLLQSNDISSASGLDPESLQRVLAPVATEASTR